MKLENVHYEYRGHDTWRIYFKDALEADDFRNERTDGQKAQIAMLLPIFTNGKGVRYCVEAKLQGQFNILRYRAKDPTNDYFSNDVWRALVKKIEGADSDYIFDEIDLWYDATVDKCYFRICCMNGTWTDLFVKNMLNSQFGMVAHANGYYDTDTVGQGGFCVRRSCCGIGYDQIQLQPYAYKTAMERIMFSVKDYCPGGKADIIKVNSWTNTFIGTNKKNEKEYSWNDFKHYMGLLHADGSDIWDIEWEYDANCPMTGTEVADELHLYLKPGAYKRLFEKEKPLLKNITDVTLRTTKVIGCGTLYYYNLYFDDKSDLKNTNDKHINESKLDSVKGTYYIRVVSYNKELPKNISSATLVWDQEEIRYSVEDFTIKGYRKDDKTFWISTGTLWSNDDYLARVQALTPPPVPKWAKLSGADFDGDTVCEYCKKNVDICKEFTAATPTTQSCFVEPIVFVNHKPCAFEFIKDSDATNKKEANNKEDNNMKIYWDESRPRIENVRDIILASYGYDRSVYYYRVYFESIVDAKNVMECSYNQDKGRHCWYYMTIASTAELSEEMKGSIKTLYLTYDKNKKKYYINWKAMYETPLKTSAHFEMKMTAQLNDEQLKVWEAALGIGNQPNHKKEKTVGDVVNEFTEEQKKVLYYLIGKVQEDAKAEKSEPTKILVQGTATIIWWSDGTKTIVKCQKGDKMDPEKGIAMCVMKKFMGTNETHSNYLDFAKNAIAEYEKQQAAEKAKKREEANKRRRAAAKKKGADCNANYKRGAKGKTKTKTEPESTEPESKEES